MPNRKIQEEDGNQNKKSNYGGRAVTITGVNLTEGGQVINCDITTLSGGSLHVSGDGPPVEIDGARGNGTIIDTTINVSKGANIIVNEESKGIAIEAISGKANFSFGQQPHAAILLSGTGKGKDKGIQEDIFMKDVQHFKDLLVDKVRISEEHIHVLKPSDPKLKITTIKLLTLEIEKIIPEFEDTKDGKFIFYYSGHFNGDDHKFYIDGKGNPEDFYLDVTLATNLLRIPARHMLFVLDMCYSGSAEVYSKDGVNEVDSTTGLTDEPKDQLAIPDMWDVSKVICKKGDGTDIRPDKIVQWSSSKPNQPSWGTAEIGSRFTNAIKNTMTMDSASVLDVHTRVHEYMKKENSSNKQEPMIRPNYANEQQYFKDFPNLI